MKKIIQQGKYNSYLLTAIVFLLVIIVVLSGKLVSERNQLENKFQSENIQLETVKEEENPNVELTPPPSKEINYDYVYMMKDKLSSEFYVELDEENEYFTITPINSELFYELFTDVLGGHPESIEIWKGYNEVIMSISEQVATAVGSEYFTALTNPYSKERLWLVYKDGIKFYDVIEENK